ncbi:MAG: hypothetical protein KAW12_28155 [Candidatus Aminicenantes bacterium]|nr:hypothetical protein [Candidatus Aminicenantes bacterium]
MEETIKNLKKLILREQFVNCYSQKFSPENRSTVEQFLSSLKAIHKNVIYIDINGLLFEQCEDEEQEANLLLKLIGKEWDAKGLGEMNLKTISIADALYKWSNILDTDKKVLLVFHLLRYPYSEKEKNLLRSLRKTIRNADKMSRYLGILIISNRAVSHWELFPESNLDDRHVAILEC